MAVSGERVLDAGTAWATQVRSVRGLLFRARRRYVVALTDRRLLVFERRPRERGGTLGVADLLLGKRYDSFRVQRRRRYPILFQFVLRGENDGRLVLEFRPSQRALGRLLEQNVEPAAPAAATHSKPGGDSPESDERAGVDEAERAAAEAFWGSR